MTPTKTPEHAQEILRSQGLCGELSPDRRRACIRFGTEHRHDWRDAVDVAVDYVYEEDRVLPVMPSLPFEAARHLHHGGNCDYVQPMWHQGPCDCGLHTLTDTFSPELKARLLALHPDDKEFGDPHGLFRRQEPEQAPYQEPAQAPYRCNVPMCGESGVCDECRRRGTR